ncbi:MAG: hypothetical protein CL916_06265 [Deltaproteobacteria bacterium]|nr:hypothetical protein [Deltaproteobacteria bacterium]
MKKEEKIKLPFRHTSKKSNDSTYQQISIENLRREETLSLRHFTINHVEQGSPVGNPKGLSDSLETKEVLNYQKKWFLAFSFKSEIF